MDVFEKDYVTGIDGACFTIGNTDFCCARHHGDKASARRGVPVSEESWRLDGEHCGARLADIRTDISAARRGSRGPLEVFKVGVAVRSVVYSDDFDGGLLGNPWRESPFRTQH
jgi:hypothetical protein